VDRSYGIGDDISKLLNCPMISLEQKVRTALKNVLDPELNMNIVDLD
jgi:hypothetical protein